MAQAQYLLEEEIEAPEGFVYAYSLSNIIRYFSSKKADGIHKEFRRAAAMLGNNLAANCNGKNKDRNLARELTKLIRRCDYAVFSLKDPEEPKWLNVKNLVFQIFENEEESLAQIQRRGQYVPVPLPAPRQKIALPYDVTIREGMEDAEFYIPGKDGQFRIALPLESKSLQAAGRAAKDVIVAFNGRGINPVHEREVDRAQTARLEIEDVVAEIGGRTGKSNRMRHHRDDRRRPKRIMPVLV